MRRLIYFLVESSFELCHLQEHQWEMWYKLIYAHIEFSSVDPGFVLSSLDLGFLGENWDILFCAGNIDSLSRPLLSNIWHVISVYCVRSHFLNICRLYQPVSFASLIFATWSLTSPRSVVSQQLKQYIQFLSPIVYAAGNRWNNIQHAERLRLKYPLPDESCVFLRIEIITAIKKLIIISNVESSGRM